MIDGKCRCISSRNYEISTIGEKDDVLRCKQYRSVFTFPSFGGPAQSTSLCIEGDKLSLLLSRVAVDQSIAINRRAHVHRNIRILPDLSCFPLLRRLVQGISMRPLTRARDN